MSGHKTPETKVTAELALKVYQRVVDHGDRSNGVYEHRGIQVIADADGYGVALTDGIVTVRVLFHNRVAIDTPNSRSLMRFRKRLAAIDAQHD